MLSPDPTQPAEEILFSRKKNTVEHPPVFFNGISVKRVHDHKHLGLVFDSKLKFTKHINEKVSVARKWIGVIKHVSPYLPVKTLDQIYKMHVRPHLDYCDVIFHTPVITHEFDSSLTLNYQMNIMEKTQYQAALAVSGCWKGTNTDKIYEQLGWESLDQRRFFRRLVTFYKIMNNMTPAYLKQSIPSSSYTNRSGNTPLVKSRTDYYLHSFYPDSLISWNNIGPGLRSAKSLSMFKKVLLDIIRPVKKEIFGIHNPGIKWIYQLRVGLSNLLEHKFNHNFIDTPSATCICNMSDETTQHFLLECSSFNTQRIDLITLLSDILLMNDMENLSTSQKVPLLLYGHENFTDEENRLLIKATISFIRLTGRFSNLDDENRLF